MAKAKREEGKYVKLQADLDEHHTEMDAELRDGEIEYVVLRHTSLNSREFDISPFFYEEGGIDKLVAFLKAVEAERQKGSYQEEEDERADLEIAQDYGGRLA